MKKLTQKQNKIYNFIIKSIKKNQYAPTIREIADAFNMTVKGAYDHLKAIEKKEYIRITKHVARGIYLNNFEFVMRLK